MSRRTVLASGGALAVAAGIGYWTWPNLRAYGELADAQRVLPQPGAEAAELVRMATLAANSQNTQPWPFWLDADRMTIRPDFTRRTAVVDPDDHHLLISPGCDAENAALVAAAQGRSGEVAVERGSEPQIVVNLEAGPIAESPRYRAVPLQQSTRFVYEGQPVSPEDLRLLCDAAAKEGVKVEIFTEAADRDAILDLVIAGNSAQMDDPAFVAEPRDWLRFTPAQALATQDGLFSATSGNPVMPGWLAPTLFGLFFTKDAEDDKYRDQIRSSAGIAVFVGDSADPAHWIKVGRSF